jgi:hypothetical protein
MSKLATLLSLLAMLAAPLQAQVPGAYPHLQLTDGVTTLVPPAGGPFDNSGVFPAFAGQSFIAQMSYASAGQANTNVLWGLLISTSKTPFSTSVTPPPLLTMPPFILLLPAPPNLDASGHANHTLFVPAGVLDQTFYVQGMIYDSTSTPTLRLSNGLSVKTQVPAYNVTFSSVRATQATDDESLVHDFGVTTIGPDVLPKLKPIGVQAPPQFVGAPAFYQDDVRFLPVTHNAPDEPINPRARPFTRINASATGTDTTLIVQDTTGFPTRGRLLIAQGNDNLWDDLLNGTSQVPPRAELVLYDGRLRDRFLNCQRAQLGSSGSAPSPPITTFPHNVGEQVLGDWTFATTSGAQARQRLSLDCDNQDMPHVVIPAFTAPGPENGTVTMDLDLYLFESKVDKVQGFVVFDRTTRTWRVLEGTLKNTSEGRWNPVICMAPDGRSFIAELLLTSGILGWNNDPNGIYAVRTDGGKWPASNSQTWQITYQIGPPPILTTLDVQSRRVWMPATAIIGPDPDNYVAFIGMAYKFKLNSPPGSTADKNVGTEAEWVRQEILVHDYIDVPLVPPGSTKGVPSMPRNYINDAFGTNGANDPIIRFDPEVLVSADNKMLFMVGGGGTNADTEEDAYVIRNVGISQAGAVLKVVGDISGFTSDNKTAIRPVTSGGHGQGRKAAFSPSGAKVAFTMKRNGTAQNIGKKTDWLEIAATNGSNYGHLKNVYDDGSGNFKGGGVYTQDAIVQGIRWADENRVLFMMGKNPINDPTASLNASNAPAFDLFAYDIAADTLTNLTKTGDGTTDFGTYGTIKPAAYFNSPSGGFTYFLRYGPMSGAQGSALPAGTQVMNLIAVNLATLHLFPITGDEFDHSALVGNLDLPSAEFMPQIESPFTMQPVAGSGAQQGMLYFTAHKQGGNQSDEIFGANLDLPFVAFQATTTSKSNLVISNVVPDPYGGRIAFARTDGPDPFGATQHPFVVDLANFLFERDVLPVWVSGGANLGRLMDGSFHFLPPSGSAGDALVFSFGLQSLPTGIALLATPAYYPLAAVSDVLAQPIPVVIPLVDTLLLGQDFRFYLNFAAPAVP